MDEVALYRRRRLERMAQRFLRMEDGQEKLDLAIALARILVSQKIRDDGGPGSGNHGHEGVKGQLGGSAPKGSNVGGEPHKPISQRSSPALKSPKNFDDYVKENRLVPLYRGLSAPSDEKAEEYAKQLYAGKSPLSGKGRSALGVGVYFTENQLEAEGYMNRRKHEFGDKSGITITAALDVGAKVADQDTINSLIQQKFDESRSFVKEAFSGNYSYEEMMELGKKSDEINAMDIATYAKGKGYDAMRQYDGTYVVMNQNALVVKNELGNDTD